MAEFRVTPAVLRDFVWRQLFAEIEAELPGLRGLIQGIFAACEATRGQMDYKTGSISLASAATLYALVRHVRPRTVFEVGTFIGRSTLAMAKAMDAAGVDGTIYTCDGSNEFMVPTQETKTKVVGHPKTLSTDALRLTAEAGAKLDLIHIDGRIGKDDLEIIAQISHPTVVVALDDFEGGEKGVVNYTAMRRHPFFAQHVLVYPPETSLSRDLEFVTTSNTAVLAHVSSFPFVSQPAW